MRVSYLAYRKVFRREAKVSVRFALNLYFVFLSFFTHTNADQSKYCIILITLWLSSYWRTPTPPYAERSTQCADRLIKRKKKIFKLNSSICWLAWTLTSRSQYMLQCSFVFLLVDEWQKAGEPSQNHGWFEFQIINYVCDSINYSELRIEYNWRYSLLVPA